MLKNILNRTWTKTEIKCTIDIRNKCESEEVYMFKKHVMKILYTLILKNHLNIGKNRLNVK